MGAFLTEKLDEKIAKIGYQELDAALELLVNDRTNSKAKERAELLIKDLSKTEFHFVGDFESLLQQKQKGEAIEFPHEIIAPVTTDSILK